MKNKEKAIVSYLFSFFLSLFLFLITLLVSLQLCLLNNNAIVQAMEKADYFADSATDVNTVFASNIRPSGLPIAMFENYVSALDVKEDMIAYLKNAMAGKVKPIDTSTIEKRMNQDIEQYLVKENIIVDAATREEISLLVNQNIEDYKYVTQFPFASQIGGMVRIYNKLFIIVTPILIVASALMVWLLKKLHKSRRRKRRYYGYACIGAGLMTSIIPLYLYGTNFFGKINLNPRYLRDTITTITTNWSFVVMGIGVLLLMAGLLFSFLRMKKK